MTVKKNRYGSLPQILDEIHCNEASGIEAAVILTYEFDPNLAHALASTALLELEDIEFGLRFKSEFPACLFFDPKRSRSLPNFPSDFEIHFKASRGRACHHSKAYALALSDGSFKLVLGSFNLTESGLFRNRETFASFDLCDGCSAEVRDLFSQWSQFLKKHYLNTTSSERLSLYLKHLDDRLAELSNVDGSDSQRKDSPMRLLSSGYGSSDPHKPDSGSNSSGLDELKKFCEQNGIDPKKLLVVSPFFDENHSGDGILQRFKSIFKNLTSVSIFSKYSKWKRTFFKGFDERNVRCFCIPSEVSNDELKDIIVFLGKSDQTSSHSNLTKSIFRDLHSKLVLLADDNGRAVLYIGSANFSKKAWLGDNFELGVAGIVEVPDESNPRQVQTWDKEFVKSILNTKVTKACLVDDGEDPQKDDEDDNDGAAAPPGWLESILLSPVGDADDQDDQDFQGRFLYFVGKSSARIGLDLENEIFQFGDLDVTPVAGIDNGSLLLESPPYPFSKLEKMLNSTRVITKMSRHRDAGSSDPGLVFIPFNIDPRFGIKAQFHMEVNPENGLAFLANLYAGKKFSRQDDARRKEAADRRAEDGFQELETPLDESRSKTHAMRQWISDLGNLEQALIKPGKSMTLRSDLIEFILMYAKSLVRPDAKLQNKKLNPTDKTFIVMELAILAARLAAAGCGQGASNKDAVEKIVAELAEMALQLEVKNRPDGCSTGDDPYRQLLCDCLDRFKAKLNQESAS